MKKKIFMLFLFVVAIILASCSSSNSRESVLITYEINTDYSSVSDKYNLGFAKVSDIATTGIDLGKKVTSDKLDNDYYNVYVSKNPETTLFRNVYDADSELESHIFDREDGGKGRNKNKTFTANSLYFNSLLSKAKTICDNQNIEEKKYEEELSYYKQSLIDIVMNQKVIDILYSTDGAFKSLTFTGYSFEKDFNASFAKSISSQYAGDAKNEGKTGIKFEIVYLPVFVVRTVGNNHISSIVMLPVYETFTIGKQEITVVDGKYSLVDSKIKDIPSKDISFDEETGTIIG
ncbi:MAG: hypothetical protein IKP77_03810 [Acholeplasmatales bacterium]|nr:hypothetical protein [Acholeplasmatales bacterium]